MLRLSTMPAKKPPRMKLAIRPQIIAIMDDLFFIFMTERHGSGDPTPCGGYPGPDCSHCYSRILTVMISGIVKAAAWITPRTKYIIIPMQRVCRDSASLLFLKPTTVPIAMRIEGRYSNQVILNRNVVISGSPRGPPNKFEYV